VLGVDPQRVPILVESQRVGLCSSLSAIDFPAQQPSELKIEGLRLPSKMMPIDFGAPRVLRSTFKHLYIRFIREPMAAYGDR
ncbi:MAG: thylakoid-associated protein, partial [Cyanobacteria bacterium J06648_10]